MFTTEYKNYNLAKITSTIRNTWKLSLRVIMDVHVSQPEYKIKHSISHSAACPGQCGPIRKQLCNMITYLVSILGHFLLMAV
jgi:hypothetical protein